MNGSAKWVIGVLGIIVTLSLVVDAMQTTSIDENRIRSIAASEMAARNEERGNIEYREIIRRLEAIDKKLDG